MRSTGAGFGRIVSGAIGTGLVGLGRPGRTARLRQRRRDPGRPDRHPDRQHHLPQGLDVLHGRPALEQLRGRHRASGLHRRRRRPTTRTMLSTLQASVDQKRASYQSSKLDTCLMTIQSSDCATLERDQPRRGDPRLRVVHHAAGRGGGRLLAGLRVHQRLVQRPVRPRTTARGSAPRSSPPASRARPRGGPSCGPNAVCDIEGTPDDSSDDLCAPVSDIGGTCADDLQCTSLNCSSSGGSGMTCAAADDAAGRDVLLQQRLLGGGRTPGAGHAAALRRVRGDRLPAGRPRAPQPLISASVRDRRSRYARAMPDATSIVTSAMSKPSRDCPPAPSTPTRSAPSAPGAACGSRCCRSRRTTSARSAATSTPAACKKTSPRCRSRGRHVRRLGEGRFKGPRQTRR